MKHAHAPLCWRCGAAVLWRPLAGVPTALETCAAGDGDVALQLQINKSEIAIPCQGTRFRRHSASCRPVSFVGAATLGKVRL